MLPTKNELLILTKTYPNPSAKYRETTCVAAINKSGELQRLFPVPFRLLDGNSQFKKWEWIQAETIKAVNDRRPESYRIDVDSIFRTGTILDTKHGWAERMKWITPHTLPSFEALEARRQATGQTLGFLRPTKLIRLEITEVKDTEWSEQDLLSLQQEGLFDSEDVKRRVPLEKLGHNFYYHYECETETGIETSRHKITDWEAGALYRNCIRLYGDRWEEAFRNRLEGEFAKRDLHLMMGTIHRFPDQWLIIGLVYPPKREFTISPQPALEL